MSDSGDQSSAVFIPPSPMEWINKQRKLMEVVKSQASSMLTFPIGPDGELVTKDYRKRGYEGCIGVVDDSEVAAIGCAVGPEVEAQMRKVKAVQTLWGGFLEHKDQCPEMWKLSLHFLRKLCDRVELYADDGGKEFARAAGLEYDAVHTLPRAKQGFDRVWSVGKLMTMQQQDCPFIHVDGDVFIREAFALPKFIVQNDEPWLYELESYRNSYYVRWEEFQAHPNNKRPLMSYCFGLVGGKDYLNIANSCSDALSFMYEHGEKVIDLSDRVDRGHVLASVLVEQIWVPMFMEMRGVPISTYLEGRQAHYDAIRKRYFHAMGGKMSDTVLSDVKALAERLLR